MSVVKPYATPEENHSILPYVRAGHSGETDRSCTAIAARIANSELSTDCSRPMAGVWVFKNGVTRLVEDPQAESVKNGSMAGVRRKVLVYVPTNQSMTCYDELEEKLLQLGWRPYDEGDCHLRQFHKSNCSNDLISLPQSFAHFKIMHMYDIVVKNRNYFEVRDA